MDIGVLVGGAIDAVLGGLGDVLPIALAVGGSVVACVLGYRLALNKLIGGTWLRKGSR